MFTNLILRRLQKQVQAKVVISFRKESFSLPFLICRGLKWVFILICI